MNTIKQSTELEKEVPVIQLAPVYSKNKDAKSKYFDSKEKQLFDNVSFLCSKLVTQKYSTSFSIGVKFLHPSIRDAIYSIYGFVRFADEIVDSFHRYNKAKLLDDFEREYYEALYEGISMNPILNSFVRTVRRYKITDDLVRSFIKSMRADLRKQEYNSEELDEYIYGSADVVGLMCLKVFVDGDNEKYEDLKPYARKLGAAFQKVNFLRDLKNDQQELNRCYFPSLKDNVLNEKSKKAIVHDIYNDFKVALVGIKRLPLCARLGVYIAYTYYLGLTTKLVKAKATEIFSKRIRVSNYEKLMLLFKAYFKFKLRMV